MVSILGRIKEIEIVAKTSRSEPVKEEIGTVAKTPRTEPEYFQLDIRNELHVKKFLALAPEVASIHIDKDADAKIYAEELGKHMKVIDLSTAHRTDDSFVYGLPELPGRRDEIRAAKFVSNPGCYATSAILAAAPLLRKYPAEIEIVTIVGVSSHTGAGKKAENEERDKYHDNILSYASVGHKHKPEIRKEFEKLAGREIRLAFAPVAVWCPPGIVNTIFVHTRNIFTDEGLVDLYSEHYAGERFVKVMGNLASPGEPSAKDVRGTNCVSIYPRWDREAGVAVIRSAIDNLVKGASGQAAQTMNLMLGLEEHEGLVDMGQNQPAPANHS
jgi:N-acetyl-gamma-glutamyl-phosphate reductase